MVEEGSLPAASNAAAAEESSDGGGDGNTGILVPPLDLGHVRQGGSGAGGGGVESGQLWTATSGSSSSDASERSNSSSSSSSRSSSNRHSSSSLSTRLSTVRFQWSKLRCIGRGFSSSVYEAVRLDTGELMAVKEIIVYGGDFGQPARRHRKGRGKGGGSSSSSKSGCSSSGNKSDSDHHQQHQQQQRRRLQHQERLASLYHREIEVVRALVHPHVVGFLGSLVEQDVADNDHGSEVLRMRIFMEYCPAGSLRQLIDDFSTEEEAAAEGAAERRELARRGLPEAVVAAYARQLLLGLAFLHFHGVAHRDIKAANVLVEEEPDSGTVVLKLADFGTARDLTRPTAHPLSTARVDRPTGNGDKDGSADGSSSSTSSSTNGSNGSNNNNVELAFVPGTPLWSAPEIVRATATGGVASVPPSVSSPASSSSITSTSSSSSSSSNSSNNIRRALIARAWQGGIT